MAWQKLIKFQKYARKIFMHIIYTYILTGAIHIYIYTRTSDKWRGLSHSPQHDTHPHADPQRNRRRCGVCFPQSTIVREFISSSRVSISSAPPLHLLCTSSACRRCLQSAQTVSPVWLWNCLRAKLKTKTGSHQRSERVAQLLLLLLRLLLL